MTKAVLISFICSDRVGLVADITGCLFDLGGNLSDTTFAVLGGGAEFTVVAQFQSNVNISRTSHNLFSIPISMAGDARSVMCGRTKL